MPEPGARTIRAVFVSYDGALDPLGGSQVVPYLAGLVRRGVETTLVSFEKRDRWCNASLRRSLEERLRSSGIRWRPCRYHGSPRVPATAWDVVSGAIAVAREVRKGRAQIVHCRGEIAMAMARLLRFPPGVRLVMESRGLFSEERVEVGSWRRGGLLDRVVRRLENGNLSRADALLVVMSKAGQQAMAARRSPLPPHAFLPNSVDTDAFRPRGPGDAVDYGLVYCGSFGSWYMGEEMVRLAKEARPWIPGRTLFLTPDVELARAAGAEPSWADVESAAPQDVPSWLRRARAAFFLIRPTPAKRASSPTKVGEALASGIPILANAGVGDLEEFLESDKVGVLVRAFDANEYRRAARQLAAMLEDPSLADRCRSFAENRYALEHAISAYHGLYLAALSRGRSE